MPAENHALVYLQDEKGHGIGFPKKLQPLVAEALVQLGGSVVSIEEPEEKAKRKPPAPHVPLGSAGEPEPRRRRRRAPADASVNAAEEPRRPRRIRDTPMGSTGEPESLPGRQRSARTEADPHDAATPRSTTE